MALASVERLKVVLPVAGQSRDRWLTRSEAARLLMAAAQHVRRFILLSLYTGRRATAVLDLTWTRVDLDQGVIRFRAEGEAETNKRRGRVRIPCQLAAHLRRWHRSRGRMTHVVMFAGERLDSIRRGIARAAQRAGLEDVTPHVLKHTAVTWAIMAGLDVEDAAEFFDTSPQTLRKTYWHHSPRHQERALEIVERRR
jgi:integrase